MSRVDGGAYNDLGRMMPTALYLKGADTQRSDTIPYVYLVAYRHYLLFD